jgi:hypothetical protein
VLARDEADLAAAARAQREACRLQQKVRSLQPEVELHAARFRRIRADGFLGDLEDLFAGRRRR